ncbi:uncharacterized protein LOC119111106 [Pollicipes pollicipes]|uniref:uncharacterized protein LOC119111106 n=1 Tax=Pollicipes pollicipes TaxID=41117 RepID=UPI001884A7A4|nr:uncharacterized protein LOC119111106 [Pollicipes pollicipes]
MAAVREAAASSVGRGQWAAPARLLLANLAIVLASRRLRSVPWTALSVLLSYYECWWVCARAPLLLALVFVALAMRVVEVGVDLRRPAVTLCPSRLGATRRSELRSVWWLVRLLTSPREDADQPGDGVPAGSSAADERAAAHTRPVWSVCLLLAAVPALLLLHTACECLFPWDGLVFHSRSSTMQAVHLMAMWTGFKALWLCPLIVTLVAAEVILRDGAPHVAWRKVALAGSVTSSAAAIMEELRFVPLLLPTLGVLTSALNAVASDLTSPKVRGPAVRVAGTAATT